MHVWKRAMFNKKQQQYERHKKKCRGYRTGNLLFGGSFPSLDREGDSKCFALFVVNWHRQPPDNPLLHGLFRLKKIGITTASPYLAKWCIWVIPCHSFIFSLQVLLGSNFLSTLIWHVKIPPHFPCLKPPKLCTGSSRWLRPATKRPGMAAWRRFPHGPSKTGDVAKIRPESL